MNKIGQPEFCVTVTFPFLKIHCRTLKADHSRSKLQFVAYIAANSSTISVYPMLQTQMLREQLELFKMCGQKYLSLQGLMIQILGWLHESFTQQKKCEFVQRASNVFYRIILQFRRSNLLCRCHTAQFE